MKSRFIALLCAALLCAMLPFAAAFAEADETPGIAGSNVQALLSDLEAFGIPTPQPETSGRLTEWKSDKVSIDNVPCDYTVTAKENGEIVQATFEMVGKKNGLFSVVASLAYDASDPQRASKFVKSNTGKETSTIIGDAEFALNVLTSISTSSITVGSWSKSSTSKTDTYVLRLGYNDMLISGKGVMARVTKTVNLRAEPNSDSARVGKAQEGDQLLVLVPYYTEKWHQISYDGQVCYVSANYCEL